MNEERRMAALEAGEPEPQDRPLGRTLALLRALSPAGRTACPRREMLADLAEERLPPRDRGPVEAHLAVCPFCAAELADYRALAAPPRLALAVRLARAGLELLGHTFATAAPLVPSPARGDAPAGLVFRADADEARLEVTVHSAEGRAADIRLHLRGAAGPLEPLRVNLLRGDALLESRRARESDDLLFAAVAAGDYRLSIEPRGGAPTHLEVSLRPAGDEA